MCEYENLRLILFRTHWYTLTGFLYAGELVKVDVHRRLTILLIVHWIFCRTKMLEGAYWGKLASSIRGEFAYLRPDQENIAHCV